MFRLLACAAAAKTILCAALMRVLQTVALAGLAQAQVSIAPAAGNTNEWIGTQDGTGSFTGGDNGINCSTDWSLGHCPNADQVVEISDVSLTFDDERPED